MGDVVENYKITKHMILSETVHLLNHYMQTANREYREYPSLTFKEIEVDFGASDFNFDLSLDDFSNLYLHAIAKVLAFKIKAVSLNPLFIRRALSDTVTDQVEYNGIILYLSKDFKFITYIV